MSFILPCGIALDVGERSLHQRLRPPTTFAFRTQNDPLVGSNPGSTTPHFTESR